RPRSRPHRQGRVALGILFLLRPHADSDWLVRRPFQPEMALCRHVSAMVAGARLFRVRNQPGDADDISRDSRDRRVHLLTGRHENCEPHLSAVQARSSLGPVRFRHPNRPCGRWHPDSLDDPPLRLAPDAHIGRIFRNALGDPMDLDLSFQTARAKTYRVRSAALTRARHTGPDDKSESGGYLPRILLFRILLVSPRKLAAGLPGNRSPLDDPESGVLRIAALFRLRDQ